MSRSTKKSAEYKTHNLFSVNLGHFILLLFVVPTKVSCTIVSTTNNHGSQIHQHLARSANLPVCILCKIKLVDLFFICFFCPT